MCFWSTQRTICYPWYPWPNNIRQWATLWCRVLPQVCSFIWICPFDKLTQISSSKWRSLACSPDSQIFSQKEWGYLQCSLDIQINSLTEWSIPKWTADGTPSTNATTSSSAQFVVCVKWRTVRRLKKRKPPADWHNSLTLTNVRAKNLPALDKGDQVWIRGRDCHGQVVRQTEYPRSYVVSTEEGMFRRNRSALVVTGTQKNPEIPNPTTKTLPEMASHGPFTSQIPSDRSLDSRDAHTSLTTDPQAPCATLAELPINRQVTRSGRHVKRPERLDL